MINIKFLDSKLSESEIVLMFSHGIPQLVARFIFILRTKYVGKGKDTNKKNQNGSFQWAVVEFLTCSSFSLFSIHTCICIYTFS